MIIPDGMTEAEVMESIDIVCKGLAHKFRFAYHEIEDIKQEIHIECLMALSKYDPEKSSLNTFLWTHARNRLYNLKRKFERKDMPCLDCPFNAYDPNNLQSSSQCKKYSDRDNCELYYNWSKRNNAKKNVMLPICINNVQDEHEPNMREDNDIYDKIDNSNIIEMIDKKIPSSLRSIWIKMKSGISVPKVERQKLLDFIHDNIDISDGA